MDINQNTPVSTQHIIAPSDQENLITQSIISLPSKNQKNSKKIILVISVIFGIIILILGAYILGNHSSPVQRINIAQTTPVLPQKSFVPSVKISVTSASSIHVYKNSIYHFQFSYPTSFSLTTKSDTGTQLLLSIQSTQAGLLIDVHHTNPKYDPQFPSGYYGSPTIINNISWDKTPASIDCSGETCKGQVTEFQTKTQDYYYILTPLTEGQELTVNKDLKIILDSFEILSN